MRERIVFLLVSTGIVLFALGTPFSQIEHKDELTNNDDFVVVEEPVREEVIDDEEEKEEEKDQAKDETEERETESQGEENMSLEIPRINGSWDVEIDVDPRGSYEEYLDDTVVHFKGTAYPGEGCNIMIAGHRCADQFRELHQMREGDEIIINDNKYKVVSQFLIEPTDWSVVEPTENERVTLMTCEHDIAGNPHKRLIVIAEKP